MRLPGSTRERPLAVRWRAGTRSARESCRTPRGCAPRSPWSAIRLVRKTATVGLEGNTYSVDSFLTGRKVELVFDPPGPANGQDRDDGDEQSLELSMAPP